MKKIKKSVNGKPDYHGITRRGFLKCTAGAGLMMGLPMLFSGCGSSKKSDTKETRIFYFDLSRSDPSYKYYLVAGGNALKLKAMTADSISEARRGNPFLSAVPDSNITHSTESIEMPANDVQICFIRGVKPSDTSGRWIMPLMFMHRPTSSVINASKRSNSKAGMISLASQKLKIYKATPGSSSYDPVHVDSYKDCTDLAKTLVFSNPEMLCADPDSAAHIQDNIIGQQSATTSLASVLQAQGDATEQGGWATLQVYIDPDTNQPYKDSQGNNQCFTKWSDATLRFSGYAISPSLEQTKNDESLGVNITNLSPDVDNPEMQGKVWRRRDGMPTVNQSITKNLKSRRSIKSGSLNYSFPNQSTDHGYSAYLVGAPQPDGTVTIEVSNSYLRYLSLCVRFVDANNNPIPVNSLSSSTLSSFSDHSWLKIWDTKNDLLVKIVEPKFEILGIPIKKSNEQITFKIPTDIASGAIILSGGIGTGSSNNTYPGVTDTGYLLTVIVNLFLPSMFLALAAAVGYLGFVAKELAEAQVVQTIIKLFIDIIVDVVEAATYLDPAVFIGLAADIGKVLLSKAAAPLITKIASYVASQNVLDSIPIAGIIMQAAGALLLVKDIAETSYDVATSPWVYDRKLSLTHNVTVTISPDPDDPAGFPATAACYIVTALFDNGGTPTTSDKQAMPSTTRTAPISYTFENVPYGGQINVSVGFYTNDDTLVGKGSTGAVSNTVDSQSITIKEVLIPLTSTTVYSHKQKTALDSNGKHIWQATPIPPAPNPSGSCANIAGQLCRLTKITVNEKFACLGYSWQASSKGIYSCGSGVAGQLNQFANISFTENPETAYAASLCGLTTPIQIAYDLLGSSGNNFYLDSSGGTPIIRQVTLSLNTPAVFDPPSSDRAWGMFNLASDAFLLHPAGYCISINKAANKVEVLKLPSSYTTDANAKIAQSYSGPGFRPGLVQGPVCAAVTPKGELLILEADNGRIQAFDVGMNPAPIFNNNTSYFMPLKDGSAPNYLDIAVENAGYIYVLSYIQTSPSTFQFNMDIYKPDGSWLARSSGVTAAGLAVDLWRNVFSLNYEVLELDGSLPDRTEPSVSQWIPSG